MHNHHRNPINGTDEFEKKVLNMKTIDMEDEILDIPIPDKFHCKEKQTEQTPCVMIEMVHDLLKYRNPIEQGNCKCHCKRRHSRTMLFDVREEGYTPTVSHREHRHM